jgi:hypothetical protein
MALSRTFARCHVGRSVVVGPLGGETVVGGGGNL